MSKITNNLGATTQLPNDLSNIKIYIYYPASFKGKAEDLQTKLSNYNVTIGETIPTANDNYNLVLVLCYFSAVPSTVNNLFNNGINLLTAGNDTKEISLIKSYNYNSIGITNIYPIVDNMITRKLNIINISDNDSQNSIHFNDDVEVWYQGSTSNSVIYDEMGYYQKNNTEWIHSQFSHYDSQLYKNLVDYIYPENGASYEITKSGTYTVNAYDKAGNVITKTISVQI